MLRRAGAPHRGGRTADLLKVKEFKDDEAIVVGHEEGAGRLGGLLGALVCRARNGAVFKVGSGFSDAERSFSRAPAVGSVITYKFFEVRHGRVVIMWNDERCVFLSAPTVTLLS